LLLCDDGIVKACGNNNVGQLGTGDLNYRDVPVEVTGISNIVQVSAGYLHSLALKADGTVWSWGANCQGQLGTGNNFYQISPTQVTGLANIIKIAAGGNNSMAIDISGNLWAWGNNEFGQLGNGTTNNSNIPALVPGMTNVSHISLGPSVYNHSVALKNDGTVWAWGLNLFGQLGNGTTSGFDDNPNPVQVSGLAGIIDISAGGEHTLALQDIGTVLSWGLNQDGQLGDNSTTNKTSPVNVQFLRSVTNISAGYQHSMALRTDGKVFTWGDNTFGQLGTTGSDKLIPTEVFGCPRATEISAGSFHSIALSNACESHAYAWGENAFGELGNRSVQFSLFPDRMIWSCGATNQLQLDFPTNLNNYSSSGYSDIWG